MQRRTLLTSIAALATTAATLDLARAQPAYPNQPIRWVVPYPAGGGTDVLARAVGEVMRGLLGQQIIVDNRPGASTNIGAQFIASSKADGYNLMSADNALLAFNEFLFSKLPFNPQTDFTFIGGISRFPLALVVHPSLPVKTVKEFIDYAKANPGKLNYASPGNGSPHHLAMEMFKARTATFITHIPYRGAAPAMQDVMGGQVQCMFFWTWPQVFRCCSQAGCVDWALVRQPARRLCPSCRHWQKRACRTPKCLLFRACWAQPICRHPSCSA